VPAGNAGVEGKIVFTPVHLPSATADHEGALDTLANVVAEVPAHRSATSDGAPASELMVTVYRPLPPSAESPVFSFAVSVLK
jgi:hypothetical protein